MRKKLCFSILSFLILFSGGCSFFRPTIFVYHFYLDYNENGTEAKEEFNNKVLTILQEYAKEMNLEYLGVRKYSENIDSYAFYNKKSRIPVFFTPSEQYIKIVGGEYKTEYLLELLRNLENKLIYESIPYTVREEERGVSFLYL